LQVGKKSAETVALKNAMDTAIGIGRQLRQIQTGRVYEKPAPIHAFTKLSISGRIDQIDKTSR